MAQKKAGFATVIANPVCVKSIKGFGSFFVADLGVFRVYKWDEPTHICPAPFSGDAYQSSF